MSKKKDKGTEIENIFKGSKLSQDEAKKIGAWLTKEIKKRGGEITPEQIVELGRPKSSPIHHLFDWDDSVAAKKWRVQQARMIVQKIVKVAYIDGEEVDYRAFLSVQSQKKERKVYMVTEDVMTAKDLRNQHIDKTLSVLENAQKFLRLLKSYD